MRIIPVVAAKNLAPERIDFGNAVVEFFAAKIDTELAVFDGAHQSTRHFVFL